MAEQTDRLCNKASVYRYFFLVLLLLISIQIAFNLSVQQAAFRFVEKWIEVSDKLYNTSGLAQWAYPHEQIQSLSSESTSTLTTPSSTQVALVCNTSKNNTEECLPPCPETPERLVGALATYSDSPSYADLERLFPWVKDGGRAKPTYCVPRYRVAIIIPYRNRESMLKTFLYNIHPILYRQDLDYGIYVIEQNGTSRFNRAMLMNIGYAEASKIYDYQCFIFHDVDLVPENDKNIYSCPSQPRHMSVAIDKFSYRLPYTGIFGGVSALTKEQFQKVNGFSNKFFGWGGEDDDMWNRIHSAGYKVIRYALDIARYKMIRHGKDEGNKDNPERFRLLSEGHKRFKTDGINSLKYKVLQIDFNHLFTRVLVDINEAEVMKTK